MAAFQAADVGIAYGSNAVAALHNVAAITLDNGHFESLLHTVTWGRCIYENTRKFVQFQLTLSVVILTLCFVSSVVISESPLSPIQILWVNLVADSLGSLALATEPPSPELLLKHPHARDEHIFTSTMVKHIIGQVVYQLVVLFIVLFAGDSFIPEDEDDQAEATGNYIRTGRRWDYSLHFRCTLKRQLSMHSTSSTRLCICSCERLVGLQGIQKAMYNGKEDSADLYTLALKEEIGPSRHYTIVFTLFVFLQLVNEVNCRRVNGQANVFRGILSNYFFLAVWLSTILLQVLITEFGFRLFSVTKNGLYWHQWLIIIAFSLGSLLVHFFLSLLPDSCCPRVLALPRLSRPVRLRSIRNTGRTRC